MSNNGNGNTVDVLREAARRAIYRDLNFSDFDPDMEGVVKVRVSLTHAETKWAQHLGEELNVKAAQWRETPDDKEHKSEREALEGELQKLADDSLVFTGSLLGLNRDETLSFFRGEDEEQNAVFEDWVKKSVGEMVQEFRQTDFLARKTRSAAGPIR